MIADCPFDAAVVVGSQGGLRQSLALVSSLPRGFPAAIVISLHHVDQDHLIEELLRRHSRLPVSGTQDGAVVEPSRVYLAPHDRGLVIDRGRRMAILGMQLGVGHLYADELLRSAAAAFGPRLIAVVLSGRLDGVAVGVREVKGHGGRVIVQSPETAEAASMPTAALATGCVDFALPPERIGDALVALCSSAGAADLFRVRLNASVSGC